MKLFIRTRHGAFSVLPTGGGYRITRKNLPTLNVRNDDEVFIALGSETGNLEIIEQKTGNSLFLSPVLPHDGHGAFRGSLVKNGDWLGDVFFPSLRAAINGCLTGNAKAAGVVC